MRTLRGFKSEFRCWDDLFFESNLKKVSCIEISHRKFTNALMILKEISHKNIFTKPRFEYMTTLLNQVHYYKGKDENMHFSFIHEIYLMSRLIRLIQRRVNNSHKLFKADIFSNFGMYSQFLATAYLSKKLKVIDVEVNNPPINSDVLSVYKNVKIHFQVKDIREIEREERLDSAINTIEYVLSCKAKKMGLDQTLTVGNFTGVPPMGLDENYWENFANGLKLKQQIVEIKIPPGLNTKNTKEILIKIKLKWRNYSGTFFAPRTNFNNWEKMVSEYTKLEEYVIKSLSNDCHILIVISEDNYNWRDLRKSIKHNKLGLLFLEIIEFRYDRSPFMLPKKFARVEKDLNKQFPKSIEFVLGK